MNDPTDTKTTARFDIFCTLVRAKKPLSISQISKKMKIPRQNVAYHMPFLEDSGLIVRDGDEYFCEPVFITQDIIDLSIEKMTDIFKAMLNVGIYADDASDDDKEQIAKNCLQAMIFIVANELAD